MTSTLRIEIRHKLPRWSGITGWTSRSKAICKRQWREYVEKALMAEGIILRCNQEKRLVWPGTPIPKIDRVTITQLIGVGGKKYDRANLESVVDKLVYDNLTHIGVIPNDGPNVMPNADKEYERTGKLWHGVRVELEYKERKEKP